MRKWHRWLSVCFGVFLLWIAVTGVLSQIVPLFGRGEGRQHAATPPSGFVCQPDYSCRPKPKPGDPRALVGLLHHLHSGESFGPVGVVIATVSGFAMVFFAAVRWRLAGSGNDFLLALPGDSPFAQSGVKPYTQFPEFAAMPLLEARNAYKPFEYTWAYEFWKRQQQVHWMPEEVPLGEDCRDWAQKISDHERNLLTQIFRFFTQADIDVQNCYHEQYGR
eukprot:gene15316-19378_t